MDEALNDIKEKANTYLWQFGTSVQKMRSTHGPIVFDRAEGCHIWDSDGRRYIDGLSGVWVVNAGHGQEPIVQAMAEQARKLAYALSEEGYANTTATLLAEKMAGLSGGEMDRVYFTCGGSESVEMAIRMARVYQRINRKPKKNKIIARRGSYHGATLLTLTVSAFDIFSKAIGPNPQGISRVAHPNCYRCEFGLAYPECGCECAKDLDRAIREEGPETVAAFVAEPISTASGVATPPAEYWRMIRRICDEHGVLLICDEIVTGAGRTGKFLCMEHYGVWPDIATMAKGISSGYSPLGAVLTHKRITRNMPDNAFLIPGYTFTGHPVSCAAAIANLDILFADGFLEASAATGDYLAASLKEALAGSKHCGEVRHLGMLACVEVVHDRDSREALSLTEGGGEMLQTYFAEHGLQLRLVENYVHVAPPLTLSRELADEIVRIIADGFVALERAMKGRA